jgi:DNA-binding IclR family transcriptional regulator
MDRYGADIAAGADDPSVEDQHAPMQKSPSYPIHSIDKALDLLTMLKGRESLRVSDVSRELGVAVSTAHRLLAMFEHAGFLSHDGRSAPYVVGPALIDIAAVIAGRSNIQAIVRPHLAELVREVNETVHVCMLRGDEVVFLDCIESSHATRAVSRKGRALPAYATSSGKVLLAEMSEPELCRLFPREDLARVTRKTILSRTALINELGRTRARGYAKNREESELAFSSYASVVRDRAGYARAAIVVAGPTSRIRRYDERCLEGAIRAAAARASAVLV